MRTTGLLIFVAFFAFCYSRCNYCSQNFDCLSPLCTAGQENVCDKAAHECHCRDHAQLSCSINEECFGVCANSISYCHNSQCYCDGKCDHDKSTDVIRKVNRVTSIVVQRTFGNAFGKEKQTGFFEKSFYDSREPKKNYSFKWDW